MARKVKSIPDGYHAITPYLCINGAAAAIEFYTRAFGAAEVMRIAQPDGRVGHAEVRIGDSHVMLADEFPEMNIFGPQTLGGTSTYFLLYVEDVDAVFNRAVTAGARVDKPRQDQVYGDRNGTVVDPFGHRWTIATHIEEVSVEEMERRMHATVK